MSALTPARHALRPDVPVSHRTTQPAPTRGRHKEHQMTAAVPVYTTLPYWRELLDRAGRNAVQTVIPVLVAGQIGSVVGLDPVNILWVALVAALVTLLKAFVAIEITPSTALLWRLLDRAGPAAAAALLSFLTIDNTGSAPVVDWRAAGIATLSAALLAIAQAYISPPVLKGEIVGKVVDARLPGD